MQTKISSLLRILNVQCFLNHTRRADSKYVPIKGFE